jgi:hypothetical protein
MFEIGIFCIILLAVGYWATLWTMGRREDVLHGQFVQAEPPAEPVPEPAAAPPSAKPLASAPPAKPSANAESLQSLLVSIKRELKDAAQM